MMLGRTIRLAGAEEIVGGRARWYTRGFVTADVTTLVVQGLGESFIFFLSLFFWQDVGVRRGNWRNRC